MSRLQIVWNRDNPRYELSIKGFRITRDSERKCLKEAKLALERCLANTEKRLAALGDPAKGATK